MPAYPLAAPPSRVVRMEEVRRAASGRERGHPRLRQLLMHFREERHQSRAPLWAATRSEKRIIQPRGLRTGRSVDLQPDAHSCPGKHGSQLWVRCGGGDNTRGGQPHRTFVLRGREPIPRCCDRHPIHGWRTELKAGHPVGQTSKIIREPDGMFAAWGGPWGCTQRRGSYCHPQISQSASRWSSARARETSTGGGRGCQSFQNETFIGSSTHESSTNLSPFYTCVHGEWLGYAKSTSQFHWRFLLSQRWSGLPGKSPMSSRNNS